MYNKVKVDDSFWTLEDGKEISIALQKVNEKRSLTTVERVCE